jgi:hypothetical protein
MKTSSSDRREVAWLVVVFVVWVAAYFLAREFLKGDVLAHVDRPTWLRVAIALLPVPPFAVCLLMFIRGIRSMDEMQRRVHLEALAIAFPLMMLLLMTLGLLQRAIELPFEDWSYAHVWIYMPLFYFGGLGYAMRRYQ